MKQHLEKTWNNVKPVRRNGAAAKATARDGGNLGLSGAVAILATWTMHDVAGLHVPPEVSVAFGTVSGYIVARMLRY